MAELLMLLRPVIEETQHEPIEPAIFYLKFDLFSSISEEAVQLILQSMT
jgi:hypothetical protein